MLAATSAGAWRTLLLAPNAQDMTKSATTDAKANITRYVVIDWQRESC
jgi:hypothetical protein